MKDFKNKSNTYGFAALRKQQQYDITLKHNR
jgi:hypothetical protein